MSRRKKIAFTLLAIALFFLLTEILLRFVVSPNNEIGSAEKRKKFAAYQHEPYVDQYFKDTIECGKQSAAAQKAKNIEGPFERYLMFRLTTECSTETIQYRGGMRRTWNPATSTVASGAKIYRVGVFGGSTVEGAGTIDMETIPSHISKRVNSGEKNTARVYAVENDGVSGYTFTQSVLDLLLRLREGQRFDYVVFYNGANDIDNAYDAGEAGALYGETLIKHKLQGGTWANLKDALVAKVGNCATCRALVILARNTPIVKDYLTPYILQIKDSLQFNAAQKKDDAGIISFANDISEYYKQSHELLDTLSEAYHFRYLEFWQPTLMQDRIVGGESALLGVDPWLGDEKRKELHRLVTKNLDAMKLDHFYDISDALAKRDAAYYLDAVHINGEGNEVVARRIADVFKKAF